MLPFRDELQAWPEIAALLDERLGAGQWCLRSLPRPPRARIFSAVPIGGCYVVEVGIGDRTEKIVVLLPGGAPAAIASGRPLIRPEMPRACAVCGVSVRATTPTRVRLDQDRQAWQVWYACRQHLAQVRGAGISDDGELQLQAAPSGGPA